ncbi:MAG: CsbD family protein [Cyanobacteria bacterium P01_H01_bin.35]
MSTKDKVKATIQDVEDKLQELMGEITGNPEYQATGQVKQDEAKAEHIVENAKDEAKKTID